MKVIVVDSCLEWADMYRTEAQAIREILGENCVAVHHIGSTAVPGLKAKPVIDIMPVVKSLAAVDEKQAAFMRLGYECMGEFGIPGRRYFRKGGENRTHQIHVFAEADGRNVARHLAVRDYLRAHPQRAREYGALSGGYRGLLRREGRFCPRAGAGRFDLAKGEGETMNFFSVFTSVFTLVVLIVPGYLLARFRMIPESLAKGLSTLLLYVCQPMLTFMSFQKTAYSSEIAVNMLIVAGVALAAHLVMIAVVFLIFRRKTDARYRVVQFSAVFGNCGFMGLPFLQALFPDAPETLIYGAVIVAVFNFLNWTVGVALLTGEKKHMKITRALFNPTSVALFISLPLFLLLKRPLAELFEAGTYAQAFTDKLLFSFDLLGNTVTPLAMIVLGIRLSEMKLKEIFASAPVYLAAAFKLILMPLLVILMLLPLSLEPLVASALFFGLSMPTAASAVLFSEQFGGDSHLASATVLLTTILSVLTIPLLFLLFQLI